MSIFKFAENILNNLDQSTQSSIQTALNKSNANLETSTNAANQSNHTKRSSLSKSDFANRSSPTSFTTTSSGTNLVNAATNSEKFTGEFFKSKNSAAASVGLAKPKDAKSKEDELINFLNSSDLSDLADAANKSIASSSTNRFNKKQNDHPDDFYSVEENVKFIVGDKSSLNNSSKHSENEDDLSTSENNESNDLKSQEQTTVTNQDENVAALQKEINSLNQEIKSLLKRIKSIEDDHQRSRKKIDTYQAQISESDKIIRELRAREEDTVESLRSKDTQLAVWRVRFDEMESEMKSKKLEIESLRNESQRILNDHTNSSDLQSQVFDNLKKKLDDLEASLQNEKELFSQEQKNHSMVQSKLENEKQSLTESLQVMQKKLNEEKNKNNEISSQLKNSKTSYNFLKQEFDDYKLKATKTLQSKERLISTLKESAQPLESSDDPSGANLSLKSIEIDELKLDRDALKDEVNSKNVTIELLRSEMIEIESQASLEIETLKEQMKVLEEQNEESKQTKYLLEQDLKNLRMQLDYAQDELYKQKSSLNTRIQERESEIERLRNQLTTKNLGTTTEKELENRLHLLTENLIQKQTLIEALQSEKHSIFLQLERSEKRLVDYESIVTSKKSTHIKMSDDEDTGSHSKMQLPLLRESPYDHEVTRKVKRAATEIDKFSIRLGVFLRKYPMARIFVLFYMFLLHLWVAIVLFTYKPEVHGLEEVSAMPKHPK